VNVSADVSPKLRELIYPLREGERANVKPLLGNIIENTQGGTMGNEDVSVIWHEL
jgi:hypothetical protein